MNICPKCGNQLLPEDTFCKNCGTPINNQVPNMPNNQPSNVTPINEMPDLSANTPNNIQQPVNNPVPVQPQPEPAPVAPVNVGAAMPQPNPAPLAPTGNDSNNQMPNANNMNYQQTTLNNFNNVNQVNPPLQNQVEQLQPVNQPTGVEAPAEEPKKKSSLGIIIIVGLVVIIGLVAVLYGDKIMSMIKGEEEINNPADVVEEEEEEEVTIEGINSFLVTDNFISTHDVVADNTPDGYVFLSSGDFAYHNPSFHINFTESEENRLISFKGTWETDGETLTLTVEKEEYAVGGEIVENETAGNTLENYTREVKDVTKTIQYEINGIDNTSETLPFINLTLNGTEVKWYSLPGVGDYLKTPRALAENGYNETYNELVK